MLRTPVNKPYNQDNELRSERRAARSLDRRNRSTHSDAPVFDDERNITIRRGRTRAQTESDNEDSDLPRTFEASPIGRHESTHDPLSVSSMSNLNLNSQLPPRHSSSPTYISSNNASTVSGAGATPSSRSYLSGSHAVPSPRDGIIESRSSAPPSSESDHHEHNIHTGDNDIDDEDENIYSHISHTSTPITLGAGVTLTKDTVKNLLTQNENMLHELQELREFKRKQEAMLERQTYEQSRAELSMHLKNKENQALRKRVDSERRNSQRLKETLDAELHDARTRSAQKAAELEASERRVAAEITEKQRLLDELQRKRAVQQQFEADAKMSLKALIAQSVRVKREKPEDLPLSTSRPSDTLTRDRTDASPTSTPPIFPSLSSSASPSLLVTHEHTSHSSSSIPPAFPSDDEGHTTSRSLLKRDESVKVKHAKKHESSDESDEEKYHTDTHTHTQHTRHQSPYMICQVK